MERREPGVAARRPKVREGKGWAAKMSGLYREEPLGEGQPCPWTGEFRVEGGGC